MAQTAKRVADRLALRVQNTVLQHDGDTGFHRGLPSQLIAVGFRLVVLAGIRPSRRATSV